MSFTYSGDPLSSSRDELRFLLGDTNENDPQYTDREIEYFLEGESNIFLAASTAASSLAAKYSRMTSKSVGDLSISYGERQDHYKSLASALALRAATSSAAIAPIYAGGLTKSDKLIDEQSTDRAKPAFKRGMHDNHQS